MGKEIKICKAKFAKYLKAAKISSTTVNIKTSILK